MRLTPDAVVAIKRAAAGAFGPGATVRLFGSRVHDRLRGGDRDLHCEGDEGQQDVRHAADVRWRLHALIEEQKVDWVFAVRGRQKRPVDRIAREEGEQDRAEAVLEAAGASQASVGELDALPACVKHRDRLELADVG